MSGTPKGQPGPPLRHARCHTCATEQATGAARATRMPARLLTRSSQGRGSTPTAPQGAARAPQPAALTSRGKTAEIPAAKAVLVLPSACLLRGARKDVFCVSKPNFPLSLASSHARLLPAAFVSSPRGQEGRNNTGRCCSLLQGGHARVLDQAARTPAIPRRSPQRHLTSSASWSWAHSKRAHAYTTQACTARWEPSVRTSGKVGSFSEQLSCVSPSTSHAPSASLAGSGNPPCRNSQAVLSHASAVRLQLQKTAPSRRVRLFLRRRDGGQRQSFRTRTAGGERYSPQRSGCVRQLKLLCSTPGSGGASPLQSFYLGTWDMPFDLPRATITQQENQPRAGSSLEARCCGRSKISQGIISKAQSDNLPDAVQAQLFSARNSHYSFMQLLCMDFSKSREKIPLLKTRMVYPQQPQRVTCGRRACKEGCCRLWDSLQCYSPPDGLTKRLLAAETALPGPG